MESSIYKYDYSSIKHPNYERLKGNTDRILNENFPQNYIDAIKQAQKEFDIVMVWLNDEVYDVYRKNNIKFCMCYPDKTDFLNNYIFRYIARGNSQRWINNVVMNYDNTIDKINHMKEKKIVLHNNQTLEDWLLENGYNLKIK